MKKLISWLLLIVMLVGFSVALASSGSEDLFPGAAKLCEEGRYQEALAVYQASEILHSDEKQALSLFASYYPVIYKNGTYDFSAIRNSNSSAYSAAVKIEKTYKENNKYYVRQVYLVTEAILYVSIDDILNQGFHEKGVAFATQVDSDYNGPFEKEILSIVNYIAPGSVKAEHSYFDLSVEEKAEIIAYINGRYEYYDSMAGGYSNDMMTDTVFAEAAEKYGLTVVDISMVWFDNDANEYYRLHYSSVPGETSAASSPAKEPDRGANASETMVSDARQLLSSAESMLQSCDSNSGLYLDIVETRQELLSVLGTAQPSKEEVAAAMTNLTLAMAGLGEHNEEEQKKQKAEDLKVITVAKETPYSVIIVTAAVSDGQIRDCMVFSGAFGEDKSLDRLTDEIKYVWAQEIAETGSADVDAITGATLSYSVAAVKEAVNDIINEANSSAGATAMPVSATTAPPSNIVTAYSYNQILEQLETALKDAGEELIYVKEDGFDQNYTGLVVTWMKTENMLFFDFAHNESDAVFSWQIDDITKVDDVIRAVGENWYDYIDFNTDGCMVFYIVGADDSGRVETLVFDPNENMSVLVNGGAVCCDSVDDFADKLSSWISEQIGGSEGNGDGAASPLTPAPTATAAPTATPTVKPTRKPSSSTPFTNKYGTPTTKCAQPGCNNYIASSGDTNCCPSHSNRCFECGKYIDGDAMYCMDCIKKALGK